MSFIPEPGGGGGPAPPPAEWTTVTLENVPAGATGVVLDVHNTSSTTYYKSDFRKVGSTQDNYDDGNQVPLHHRFIIVALTDSQIQVKIEDPTDVKYYVVGWAFGDVVLFTNGIDVTPASTGVWADVDVSNYVSADAKAAIVKIVNTNTSGAGAQLLSVRKNGSTDDFAEKKVLGDSWIMMVVGLDDNKIFEAYRSRTDSVFYLMGYIKGENIVMFTNAVDKSITVNNTWVDVDLSDVAPNAVFSFWDFRNTNTVSLHRKMEIRPNGATYDYSASAKVSGPQYHIGAFQGVANNKVELYTDDYAHAKFMLMGYAKAPPPVVGVPRFIGDSLAGAAIIA
jgi:hypothetical protein